MPLFKKNVVQDNNKNGTVVKPVERSVPTIPKEEPNIGKPQLVFHCQLAHGSPTGLISGFANVKELYIKIAEVFDIPASDVST